MSSLAAVLNFCPVYCPYCAQRLRIIDDQQRRMDFFNTGTTETCLTCGAGFRFASPPRLPVSLLSSPRPSPDIGEGEKAST